MKRTPLVAVLLLVLALALVSCGNRETAEDTLPVESSSPVESASEPTTEPEKEEPFPAPEQEPEKEPVETITPEPTVETATPEPEPEATEEPEVIVTPEPEQSKEPEQEPEQTKQPEETKAPEPTKEPEQQESQQAQQSASTKFTYPEGTSTAGLPAAAIEQGFYYRLSDGVLFDQNGNPRGHWAAAEPEDAAIDTPEEKEAMDKANQENADKIYNGDGSGSDVSGWSGAGD